MQRSLLTMHLFLAYLAAISMLAACGGHAGDGGLASEATPPGAESSTLPVVTPNSSESGVAEGLLPLKYTSTVGLYNDDYPVVASGKYLAINNNWNALSGPCLTGSSQKLGISNPKNDGSVDFRIQWNWLCSDWHLSGFPNIAYGVPSSSEYISPSAGASLPRAIGQISSLITRHQGVQGSVDGGGYLTFSLWTSKVPTGSMRRVDRDAEILMPLYPINGFGIPRDPPEAVVGRENQTQRIGWDPRGYRGRFEAGGGSYDVYYYPAGTYRDWIFICLLPVQYSESKPIQLEWRPILDFLLGKQWLDPSAFLANVELGVEIYNYRGAAVGDWRVRAFGVDVR